jgi:deoxyribonuclease V
MDIQHKDMTDGWPDTASELIEVQRQIGRAYADPWRPEGRRPLVGAVFVCFAPRAGGRGENGWAGAVLTSGRRLLATNVVSEAVYDAYVPGLLALREGPLLDAAARGLPERPDVLLVNATGRDHPRRAGLAVHLGWALGVPTVGVTDRPLLATAPPPGENRGDNTLLLIDDDVVGHCVRTRASARPVFVHAAWRTAPDTARDVVLRCVRRARTPEPLRRARKLARLARAGDDIDLLQLDTRPRKGAP